MDTMLPCSATNNSSCSRSVGVMCAFTCAVRFSRLMVFGKRNPGALGRDAGGKDRPHQYNGRRSGRGRLRGSSAALYLKKLVVSVELLDPIGAGILDPALRELFQPLIANLLIGC